MFISYFSKPLCSAPNGKEDVIAIQAMYLAHNTHPPCGLKSSTFIQPIECLFWNGQFEANKRKNRNNKTLSASIAFHHCFIFPFFVLKTKKKINFNDAYPISKGVIPNGFVKEFQQQNWTRYQVSNKKVPKKL